MGSEVACEGQIASAGRCGQGRFYQAEQELVIRFGEECNIGAGGRVWGQEKQELLGTQFFTLLRLCPFLCPYPCLLCLLSPPCHPAPICPTHTQDASSLPSTRMVKGETCVCITFCPKLQDQSVFCSSGIMADFVVQCDVVSEDIADVQVRGPQDEEGAF